MPSPVIARPVQPPVAQLISISIFKRPEGVAGKLADISSLAILKSCSLISIQEQPRQKSGGGSVFGTTVMEGLARLPVVVISRETVSNSTSMASASARRPYTPPLPIRESMSGISERIHSV